MSCSTNINFLYEKLNKLQFKNSKLSKHFINHNQFLNDKINHLNDQLQNLIERFGVAEYLIIQLLERVEELEDKCSQLS